ncbi:hypothetical protein F9C07_2218153 [Aspergillus flavus]|uniref:Uncharacterized protein n=1 Tax=Aspergillus flavus (strain ATCC 200026 / FGSC A1120 / IAM 13836 / NRRL 3357 / JCM 12722 / SRRC 167) TaxID=332952 RepID=A0A7U2QSU0_ASPFN|nr:hypothetical protein F9C07_2218153 [Aspergillus flavus]
MGPHYNAQGAFMLAVGSNPSWMKASLLRKILLATKDQITQSTNDWLSCLKMNPLTSLQLARGKLSNCHHWVRDTINRLKNDDACNKNVRENAVHISEGKWREIDEFLEQDPNMYLNVRDQDGMSLGIEHHESASQNYMSQQIAQQRGMNSDDISTDDNISTDGISSHVVDQIVTTPYKVSLDGLDLELIHFLSLDEHPMVRNRQDTVIHRAMNQNIPRQNSIGWNTTHRYDTNQNHMTQEVVRTKNQDSDHPNNKTPKRTKHSKWCCFS